MDRCDRKALMSFSSNFFVSFSASTFLLPGAAANTNVISNAEDNNIKELTEMMQSLALSIQTILTHLGQRPIGISQSSLPRSSYQLANNSV